MNELPFPDDLADGVIAGEVSGAPAELAPVAHLFARAAQPASADEVMGWAAAAAEFEAAAFVPHRVGRISRRALAAVAGVVLTAGTAAAAAGVLSSEQLPAASTTSVESHGRSDEHRTSTSASDEETEDADEEGAAGVAEEVDPDVPQGPDGAGPAAEGLCTAWGNGATKSLDIPAFGSLAAAAEAVGLLIDDYCAEVAADEATNGDEMPGGKPDELPVGKPDELPVGPPVGVPGGVPDELPVGPPVELPVELPDEVPTELPDEVPTELPDEVPTELPGGDENGMGGQHRNG